MSTVEHSGAFLTVREVADELRCHPQTVRRLIREGAIEAVQLGGKGAAVRIERSAFQRWLHTEEN